MSINEPINYKFPYAWNEENMPGLPKVNPLLKSLIERDYRQAKLLLSQGATFKGIDHTTLRRCLFEFLEDYNLIKFMVDNGFNAIYFHAYPSISSTVNFECIDRPGYGWSLAGRAFMLGKRNVLELLFESRFEPGQLWNGSKVYNLSNYAMRTNHITLIDILLSHGYSKQALLNEVPYSEQNYSKAYQYVASDPEINWRSYGLGKLEKEVPIPTKPELSRFMFKKTKERLMAEYGRKLDNYKKEVAAKKAYIKTLSKSDLEIYFKKLERDPELRKAMDACVNEILEEGRKAALEKAAQRAAKRNSNYHNSGYNYSVGEVSHKSYEEDVRETKINQFSFVDASGSYRRWGDTFVDCKGNYVSWGGTFVDGAGNYVAWGNSFVDGAGNYRRWGDDFVDGAGNYVRIP